MGSDPPDLPFFYFKIKQGWVWEVSSKAGAGSGPLAANLSRWGLFMEKRIKAGPS